MISLEERLDRIEANQREFGDRIAQAQEKLRILKNREIKTGPLAPLAKALAYHHQMVDRWAYLAEHPAPLPPDSLDYMALHAQFVAMRSVVTHYEYVAQCLLGINPSPLADLEEEKGKEHER